VHTGITLKRRQIKIKISEVSHLVGEITFSRLLLRVHVVPVAVKKKANPIGPLLAQHYYLATTVHSMTQDAESTVPRRLGDVLLFQQKNICTVLDDKFEKETRSRSF